MPCQIPWYCSPAKLQVVTIGLSQGVVPVWGYLQFFQMPGQRNKADCLLFSDLLSNFSCSLLLPKESSTSTSFSALLYSLLLLVKNFFFTLYSLHLFTFLVLCLLYSLLRLLYSSCLPFAPTTQGPPVLRSSAALPRPVAPPPRASKPHEAADVGVRKNWQNGLFDLAKSVREIAVHVVSRLRNGLRNGFRV